jgi:hypothetical protein
LHGNGYRVYGVDLPESAIEAAKHRQIGQFSALQYTTIFLQVDAAVSIAIALPHGERRVRQSIAYRISCSGSANKGNR